MAPQDEEVLNTTIAINICNPTIVACWDLTRPSNKETRKILRPPRARLESVNPKGDSRVHVPKEEVRPDGQYGAICKLFMSYADMGGDEYIGTGWLIGPSLIVTAGHCGIESGHVLNYIKVYFGYWGPESVGSKECTYRHGTRLAIPAEYLKADNAKHDVCFIELDKPVNNIKPLKYVSTPTQKTQAKLGVVGYPGDIDGGKYMCEEWVPVTVDLARTNGLLSYNIDTSGGQSGSPVLMHGPSTAVGVHVEGGFPNVGSVIGVAGNVFGEYIAALKVIGGEISTKAAKVDIPPNIANTAPGFAMVRVEPGTFKENAKSIEDLTGDASATDASSANSSDDDSGDGSTDSGSGKSSGRESLPEKMIDRLWGVGGKSDKKGKTFKESGVMHFPERLRRTRESGESPPDNKDIIDATKKATDHPDVQTTFFINFPPDGLDSASTDKLNVTVDMVQSWQAWSSSVAEGLVQKQIDSQQLPSDKNGEFARGTYRAKVFDTLFRQATWFAKTFEQSLTKHLSVQKVDFHTAILKAVLEGFSIPATAFIQLEKILTTIGNNITLSREKSDEKQQYWLMLTRYDWQPLRQVAQPVIRVISFSIDKKMSEYTAGKSKYTSIEIDMVFSQYQADFISRVYKEIQTAIDDGLVKAGMALVNAKSFNIPV